MNKREKTIWFIGIFALAATIALSGCGNPITGVGKDISHVGDKVTTWQNEKPTEKKVTK